MSLLLTFFRHLILIPFSFDAVLPHVDGISDSRPGTRCLAEDPRGPPTTNPRYPDWCVWERARGSAYTCISRRRKGGGVGEGGDERE